MHHLIYQIVNKTTGEYYIGIHSTSNIDDGYMGSGKRIRASIKKHGIENFHKVILHDLSSREDALMVERQYVNSKTLKDENCLNLCLGGIGTSRTPSPQKHKKVVTDPYDWILKLKDDPNGRLLLRRRIGEKTFNQIAKIVLYNESASVDGDIFETFYYLKTTSMLKNFTPSGRLKKSSLSKIIAEKPQARTQ